MAGIKSISMFLVIATVLVAAFAPCGEAAIGCGQVASFINPCIPYVTGKSPTLGSCCSGVKGLAGAAKTTPDRQSTCNCLKSFAKAYNGAAISKAAGLLGQCGVSLPYKISPSTDCAKVQ